MKIFNRQISNRKIIVLLAIIVFVGLFLWWFSHATANYAVRAAEPLERELRAAGAIRKCTNGDGGHGLDNYSPWYEATYEVPRSRSDTLALITGISQRNGFTLKQATPEYKGALTVDEKYLHDNYFDHTSKKSTYPGFTHGNVELTFRLYKNLDCLKSGALRSDDTHTPLVLEIRLPDSRD